MRTLPGAPYLENALIVVETEGGDDGAEIDLNVRVLGVATAGLTLKLPANPEPGHSLRVVAAEAVTLNGNGNTIAAADAFVGKGTSSDLVFYGGRWFAVDGSQAFRPHGIVLDHDQTIPAGLGFTNLLSLVGLTLQAGSLVRIQAYTSGVFGGVAPLALSIRAVLTPTAPPGPAQVLAGASLETDGPAGSAALVTQVPIVTAGSYDVALEVQSAFQAYTVRGATGRSFDGATLTADELAL